MESLAIIIGGCAVLATIQNGQAARLGKLTRSKIFPSLYIYFIQTIVSLVYYIIHPSDRFKAPIWSFLAGPILAIFIFLISITTRYLGSAMSITCLLSTQMIASGLIDNFGLFDMPILTLTTQKGFVSILAVGAISFDPKKEVKANPKRKVSPSNIDILSDEIIIEIGATSKENGLNVTEFLKKRNYYLLILLAIFNGILLTIGSTLMGTLGTYTSASFSSLCTSASGLIVLLVAFLFEFLSRKNSYTFTKIKSDGEWWIYFIGWSGGIYMIVTAALMPVLGATVFFAVNNIFQILAAILLDHFGWFGVKKSKITFYRLVSAAILLVCTALLTLWT
jgi:transporter family-2 protein